MNISKKMSYHKIKNYDSKNQSPNKFINIKNGDIQLFQKIKKKHNSIENPNTLYNINRTKTNNKFNKFKKTLNNCCSDISINDKNMNSCINKNKPLRLSYFNNNENNEINRLNFDKIYNLNKYNNIIDNNIKDIENKINLMKSKCNFGGDDDEFIKYLKVMKIKSDLTNLVEIIFNNGEDMDEEKAQECFNKLENLLEYKNSEDKIELNVYQYLAEQLLKINNLNKNEIMNKL
jgi:hypothetical protein